MNTININQIKSANDVKTRKVDVPEWGGHLFVKEFSGKQRDEFDSAVAKKSKNGVVADVTGLRVLMCILACCDEARNAIFSKQDADALGEKSAAVLQRIFDAASELNGMKAEQADGDKENFTPPQSGESGSV
jgi:hypothetical protein